jgi:hypothetical protein
MPKVSPIQQNFNAGEISPLMYGRTDIDKYKNALKVCLNGIPYVQGGWTRRPGTYFSNEVKDSTKATRTTAFKFSTTQAYILEWGNLYVRFNKNNGPVLEATKAITGATAANPVVITAVGHGYSTGDHVEIASVGGMTQINARRYSITKLTDDTFSLQDLGGTNVNGTAYTTYTSGGTAARVYTVVTPYATADLFQLRFTQSADTLYIFHPGYKQRSLSRTGDTAWTLTTLTFLDGPYLIVNATETTLTPSAATAAVPTAITGAVNNGSGLIRITATAHGLNTGDHVTVEGVTGTTEANGDWFVTRINANDVDLIGSAFVNTYIGGGTIVLHRVLTASSIEGINDGVGFKTTDAGRFIRLKQGSVWGYVVVRGYVSATEVRIKILSTLTNTNAKVNWRLGLWSDTTGYPACGTFYEDRLVQGGNTSAQARLDGSRTSNYLDYSPSDTDGTVTDSHAISFTLNAADVQVIRWMLGDDEGLMVGTYEGEWMVRPATSAAALTPTSISARQSLAHGSANVQAVRAGKGVLYVQKSQRKVRELTYTLYPSSGLVSPDMTVLAEHITKGPTPETSGVKEMAYQQEPVSIVWGPRYDGVLLGFTYEREQKVEGWHRHILGGYSDAGHLASPVVESVASIPAADGKRDEVWMVVQRYINGRSVRYIEYMTKIREQGDAQEDAFYVDCGLTYDGSPTTTISGLYHLAGETVAVFADGAAHVNKVVSATGTITLDVSASVVQVGYNYNSDGQMLRLDAGAADGTAIGKFQRSHRVAFLVHDTLGLKVGSNFNTSGPGKLTELPFRTSADPTDTMVPLFSGIKDDFTWEGDSTKDNYACWRIDTPFPATILAVMPRTHTQDAWCDMWRRFEDIMFSEWSFSRCRNGLKRIWLSRIFSRWRMSGRWRGWKTECRWHVWGLFRMIHSERWSGLL